MKRWQRSLHFLKTCNNTLSNFQRGISLHGHTHHSRESLGFLNHHIGTIPIVAQIARHAMARYRRDHGKDLDFNRAFWTTPLSSPDAHEHEKKQIEDALGLEGIVSLTDHDNINGVLEPASANATPPVVSLEWTVPYAPAYLHLGVHNLPPALAPGLTCMLNAYTQSPEEAKLGELLAILDRIPDVLLVLNHPMWEMEPIGRPAVRAMVLAFLRQHGRYIHALEVNGLRPWRENQEVLRLAHNLSMAVVSGGDRHGCEPSAMLNLTSARSFSEFVVEVRQDGRSEIAVMPTYHREPFGLRMMQVAWDVLRRYPAHPCGRKLWTERIFFTLDDGTIRPLSACFRNGDPAPELRILTGVMQQLEAQPWRSLLHAAWSLHPSNHDVPTGRQSLQPIGRPAVTNEERSVV